MRIGEVTYTNLTNDFGYWTVKVEDIGDYLPIKIDHEPGKYNPFIGWKIDDEVEKFIENTVREIVVPETKLNDEDIFQLLYIQCLNVNDNFFLL